MTKKMNAYHRLKNTDINDIEKMKSGKKFIILENPDFSLDFFVTRMVHINYEEMSNLR